MADETTPSEGDVSESTPDFDAAAEGGESTALTAGTTEDAGEAQDYDLEADEADDPDEATPVKPRMSHVRLATIVGLVVVVALAALTGWLGYRAYESRQADDLRNLFLQVGRQGALNLTTISHEHAEQDVQRVLDSSTGTFYDDFQARAQPFIEVVKQAQSKSEGTISEAGIESLNDDEAKVLVAVTVNTTNAGAPEQAPRSWRMRISVQKTGEDEAKISNVEFVP
ncbi:Mce protein [Mycobacterium sp. E136]|uniref:Mce protein n=1 Tax=Mycobacterium sp. E136 TaxID=1834125 RepID=UPI0008001B88|nr:Mce protein [Mycobacterium sp. E136]OBG92511.1 Mce protein [Mycobacterium sp. E136]